jgi:hypothetical protein
VNGILAPAQVGPIHDVVVHKAEIVEGLYHQGHDFRVMVHLAQGIGPHQYHYGPEPFAAKSKNVPYGTVQGIGLWGQLK